MKGGGATGWEMASDVNWAQRAERGGDIRVSGNLSSLSSPLPGLKILFIALTNQRTCSAALIDVRGVTMATSMWE